MKTYTIIGGINGAGKSSFTGSLKYQIDDLGIVVDVDKITAEKYNGDSYVGGQAAISQIENCLAEGVNFTQETTLSGGYTKRVAKQAKEAGYYIRMFYIGIDTIAESRSRINNRVKLGGHDIPDADIERRFIARFSSLSKILPFCNVVAFFDNRNGFVEVGEYRNGEIIQRGNYCPMWLKELTSNVK
ncbi:MAG: hypothetical protein RSD35_00650 [Oscillospiraceae bacterium]